jgi:hypothetical protein
VNLGVLSLGIGIGAVAGLLILPALLLGAAVYEKWVDREARISGNYGTYDDEGSAAPRVGRATIIQYGRRVRVIVHRQINHRGEQQQEFSTFIYRGRFQNGVLCATFRDSGATFRSGVVVLAYIPGQHDLVGATMYVDNSVVCTFPYILRLTRTPAKPLKGTWRERVALAITR